MELQITPQILLKAYACGVFPMAETANSPDLFWIDPERRGILPLDSFHIPKRLARTVSADKFTVRTSKNFKAVISACASTTSTRRETWINTEIRQLYTDLFEMGYCQTIEVYNATDKLVGGLYGVSLGGAFFGESMFSLERDASKVALVHLYGRLLYGKYRLLDAQFVTTHLKQFGAIEVQKDHYAKLLDNALTVHGDFNTLPQGTSGKRLLQIIEELRPAHRENKNGPN
ncbi:Leucyl/phenylalanyl-tRNA--protein transferase [Pseudovibrio axinellae]|uniref:Leucyl/phenylalanyl-tRNA--protein transferase n=1 Tax=Pseudovibrio axinellae TaxID=989403 RepID=A0A166B1X3_9HYPH|nr:leucyl/phenylalanyl-tRNA--protein transferase [Pseudovibrio axinellae]KZL21822.1 Leucyl/phenylalanyl-tRNA--protein transferase [Pseudovibrio axinellae]SEQ79811.1 leucyl/phenylalanyl-tRNA--protein transferase [Pseudovibrio axinellae]